MRAALIFAGSMEAVLRGLLAVCAALAMGAHGVIAAPEGSRFNADYFTNTEVVAHNGKRLRFYDDLIKDKIVVISFVYLTCNDICPLTTARIAEIRRRLGNAVGRDIFIYSITMDPERDTPELLDMYAHGYDAGEGWLFLTGKPDDLRKLRWRLGERSRTLAEHRNDLVLGNDRTGEWSRSSVYSDIDVSVRKILELDPAYRGANATTVSGDAAYRIDKQTGQALFVKACSTCHHIGGGRFVGPDLKDVGKRRDPAWLRRFIMEPDRMRAENDPLTMALSAQYPGVLMPNLGLKENDVADVLAYIEARSGLAAETAKTGHPTAAGQESGQPH